MLKRWDINLMCLRKACGQEEAEYWVCWSKTFRILFSPVLPGPQNYLPQKKDTKYCFQAPRTIRLKPKRYYDSCVNGRWKVTLLHLRRELKQIYGTCSTKKFQWFYLTGISL